MEARTNYGPVKKKQEYVLLEEGCDWLLIRVKGTSVYVPKWVFEDE